MQFVLIDLIPALLRWEGRDRSRSPVFAPEALEAVAHLYSHYRVVGIADAGIASLELLDALAAEGIEQYFDSVLTSAGMGPAVTPRVVRRMVRTIGDGPIVVTGREQLANALSRARMGVVFTDQADFGRVPEAVAMLVVGRVSR